jgi:hypothetical protein
VALSLVFQQLIGDAVELVLPGEAPEHGFVHVDEVGKIAILEEPADILHGLKGPLQPAVLHQPEQRLRSNRSHEVHVLLHLRKGLDDSRDIHDATAPWRMGAGRL